MPDIFPFWFIPLLCALLGACIGSFLNVVIYRVPLGISINKPNRSFCPSCKTPIPWTQNIPICSWLLLKGKCRACKMSIPFRYWIVELTTAILFGSIAWANEYQPIISIALMCLWCGVAIAISWIDAEHMLVFPALTIIGTILGALRELSGLTLLDSFDPSWGEALINSILGATFGYLLIRGIIILGRLLFGKWSCEYSEAAAWKLVDPTQETEELILRLPGKDCTWSDMFARPSDKALLRQATVVIDGKKQESGDWILTRESFVSPTGEIISLADIHSAQGSVLRVEGRREAMGSGDAWIMMMVGSICGWQGVIFSIFLGSLFGMITGIASTRGRGTPIPFGPSLLAAAVVWLLGGHTIWTGYMMWALGSY